jgi:TDG/mug DNA glycosylase family protein
MRLLVCGLNPSLISADAGIPFFRASNRFWRAAVAAGLLARERDPRDALRAHGVGFTDLVKRATARADALGPEEYRDGLARVVRLVQALAPRAVCVVGLAGYRAAVDGAAAPGVQPRPLGGRPVYLMPSTSGAAARASLAELAAHLRAALALAEASR